MSRMVDSLLNDISEMSGISRHEIHPGRRRSEKGGDFDHSIGVLQGGSLTYLLHLRRA